MAEKDKKTSKKNRADTVTALPEFLDQMMLLLNSGKILSEAFMMIAEGYRALPDPSGNYLTAAVIDICDRSRAAGEDVIIGFYRFAASSNIKELSRVARILSEDRAKGTDLWEKLTDESERLWDERRSLAAERIRLAESRMSFPLGMMLIALIIITAAPAMQTI